MRLAGPNVFGPPADRAGAVALLREAVDSGVDHIDTAEYYGPTVVNELIRETVSPYPPDLVLVSEVGAERCKRGEIFAYDRPDQLGRGIEDNLKTLGVDSIGAVNLRLMRASAPNASLTTSSQS
jgi:pyridoxine 4-dehydrogenase